MNQRTARTQSRMVRLALLSAVILLGGCATHSTRYYAEDAGYGYYDEGYDEGYDNRWYGASAASASIHVGSYYGYWDPWVYPYASLDLFYFGPFAYRSSIAFYSPWAYVPFHYRYPFGYSFGYGYGYGGGFGYGYYGWPSWSYPRYYGHSGHRDRYRNDRYRNDGRYGHDRDHYRQPVDARVRALSHEPAGTPTRRALLGNSRSTRPTSRVTDNPSRAQLISNGSSRSAMRGELGGESRNRSAVRAPVAPAANRSRLLTPSDSGRNFDTRTAPRDSGSRRVLSSGSSASPRSLAPAPQSRANRAIPNREASERVINPRSRMLDRSATNRGSSVRSVQSAPPPANRAQTRAPAPVSRSEARIRQAAPPPQAAPPRQQRAIRAPAAVRPATPPPARSTERAVRPAAPPRQSSSRDRRREALSGRRDDGRRN